MKERNGGRKREKGLENKKREVIKESDMKIERREERGRMQTVRE